MQKRVFNLRIVFLIALAILYLSAIYFFLFPGSDIPSHQLGVKGAWVLFSATFIFVMASVIIIYKSIRRHQVHAEEINKLSMVASHISNAVIILDQHGCIEWINNGFTMLTGYTMEEAKGVYPHELLSCQGKYPARSGEIDRLMASKEPFATERMHHHKNGQPYWVKIWVTPILKNNKTESFIAIYADITERKKFVEQLEQKNEQLTKIAWIQSHKVRNHVANILGLVKLFSEEQTPGKNHAELIRMIAHSATNLDNIVHEISSHTQNSPLRENKTA